MSIKKQFIAGAVCPACKKTDVIQRWIFSDKKEKKLYCTACDYCESITEKNNDQKTTFFRN